MNPESAFLKLCEFAIEGDYNVTLALATYCEDDELPEYRSLNISSKVGDAFADTAADVLGRFIDDWNDVLLHEYSGGYKPDRHEIEYMDVSDGESLAGVLGDVPAAADIPLLGDTDDFVDDSRFYAVILQDGNKRVVLFKKFSRNKELTRSRKLIIRLMGDRYDVLKEPTFQFDNSFDAILFGDYIFSPNKSNFQHMFRFYQLLEQVAEQSLDAIKEHVPIANFDAFRESCLRHRAKLEKLRNIAQKPYLKHLELEELKRVIKRFDLQVEVASEDGQQKLVFDDSNRWEILHLLDDAYLDSRMTGNKYEANSKRQL